LQVGAVREPPLRFVAAPSVDDGRQEGIHVGGGAVGAISEQSLKLDVGFIGTLAPVPFAFTAKFR
jgi:hypothetical protein